MTGGTRPSAIFASRSGPAPVSAPSFSCTVPRRFDPTRSVLGHALRRGAADARHAEARYLTAVVLLGAVGMLAGQWTWLAFVRTPDAATASLYFAAQAAGVLGFALLALWGWRPALHVSLRQGALHVRQGDDALAVGIGALADARRADAAEVHTHWRLYARTRAFIGRSGEALVFRLPDGAPVVLALPTDALDALEAALAEVAVEEAVGIAA